MKELPDWLLAPAHSLADALARDQLPHAILIHGPAGTGRRLLALWIAARALGIDESPLSPDVYDGDLLNAERLPAHADLTLVQPEPNEYTIKIDRIRELIKFMHLTSYQKGSKVALISPAQALTSQAANSLLKTLEEPPGATVIVLVTDALSRLPATIISRCHRLRVNLPADTLALNWLQREYAGVSWSEVLDLAGGAPLTALKYQEAGFPEEAVELEKDIRALKQRQISPIAAAQRWARRDDERCLAWLYLRASAEVRALITGEGIESTPNSSLKHLQSQEKNLTMDARFSYLQEIGELRRLRGTGINKDLNWMYLLSRWYGGLQNG
jgi:DNA polymerase-3 subunit delta'